MLIIQLRSIQTSHFLLLQVQVNHIFSRINQGNTRGYNHCFTVKGTIVGISNKGKKLVSNETLVLQFIEIVNTKRTKNRIYIITPERGEEIFKNIGNLNLELILLDEAQISEEGIRGMKFDSLVRRIDKN